MSTNTQKEKRVFNVNIDGKDVAVKIRNKTIEDEHGARKVFNQTCSNALSSGAMLREKLNDFMKKQDVWSDEKEAKYQALIKQLADGEQALDAGGIKLSQARQIALNMVKLRNDIRELIAERVSMDAITAQGQADNERFNYIVSVLAVYNDNGNPVFKSLDDYLNKANEPWAFKIAQKVAALESGVEEDLESTLPENQFLKKYDFVNELGQLVDKNGNLVDLEGNLIEQKEKVEFSPFLDDDGKPIGAEQEVEVVDKVAQERTRPKTKDK